MRDTVINIGRRPIPEPPRQSPAACHYRRLCTQRQEMLAAWWAWLASNPPAGDVALELAATQSTVRQLAEITANASAAQ
jgi:hypothetical protein